MDVEKKWSKKDISCAKSLLALIRNMHFSRDIKGDQIGAIYNSIQWLSDLIIVMENPPIPFEPRVDENKTAPAGVLEGNKLDG